MSDLGLAYQEYDFYEELFEKPKRIKRKKEPIQKFQLKLRTVQAKTPNQQLAYDYFLSSSISTFCPLAYILLINPICQGYNNESKAVSHSFPWIT